LTEGVIDSSKKILSTGSISIPNPYDKTKKTIFKDWKAHGWTNMAEALAVSSDVYFYEIGGGYEDQKGLGIANIEKYAKLFGLAEKTGIDLPDEKRGVIPSPEWKAENFKGDVWRVGDTYNTAIGQYGFQVTLTEATRAVSAIANYGKLLTPHFILGDKEMEEKNTLINISKEHFDIVHDGMRQAVTYGTAVALNVPYVQVAAKTGTAQIGVAKNKVNSWVIGFFPYENPRYAFTIMMEAGPSTNSVNATSVMRQLLDWMSINTPEYLSPSYSQKVLTINPHMVGSNMKERLSYY
jgi:penicillin-binding protein 2